MADDDKVSPQLRIIEKEIDNYFLLNPLVSHKFSTAAWYTMAIYEELAIKDFVQERELTIHDLAGKADYIVVHIQYPLRWLWTVCEKGGDPPKQINSKLYKAAWDIQLLAHEYIQFCSAYTYASYGLINLILDGNTIRPEKYMFSDSRYEVYDRLIKPQPVRNKPNTTEIAIKLAKGLTISEYDFHYQTGKRLVKTTIDILEPVFEELFELPPNWHFVKYSLVEFRKVSKVLLAMGFIHYIARIMAASNGVKGLALQKAILVLPLNKLEKQIVRYSNVTAHSVNEIISDLTFGSAGIRKPDPALQPIIPLNNEQVAIMPNLVISSSLERNFISLLNRIPEERNRYLSLVDEKEDFLRKELVGANLSFPIRHYNGSIPGRADLPDIDIAFISEDDQSAIVAEIKWFIGPSEPREVIEKGREIQRGVEQQKLMKKAFQNEPSHFFDCLSINKEFDILFIVISQNSIGPDWAQDPEIPVIQANHFLMKFSSVNNIKHMITWLRTRSYLPKEGEDYELITTMSSIGEWNLEWYGFKSLKGEPFF